MVERVVEKKDRLWLVRKRGFNRFSKEILSMNVEVGLIDDEVFKGRLEGVSDRELRLKAGGKTIIIPNSAVIYISLPSTSESSSQ